MGRGVRMAMTVDPPRERALRPAEEEPKSPPLLRRADAIPRRIQASSATILGMQAPPSPVKQRLRTVRRRITTGVLATFATAWLAVAAFGKGGTSETTSTTSSSSGSSTTTQSDDGGSGASQSDKGSSGASQSDSDSSGATQSGEADSVTTAQS